MSELMVLRLSAVTVVGVSAFAVAFVTARNPRTLPARALRAYSRWLELRSGGRAGRAALGVQAAVLAGLLATAIAGAPWVLVGGLVAGGIVAAVLEARWRRRVRAIVRQAEGFLVRLAEALVAEGRSGVEMTAALADVVFGAPEPLRAEIERVSRAIARGATVEGAFREMAERLADPTIDAIVTLLLVARRKGDRIGPTLIDAAAQVRRRAAELERLERRGLWRGGVLLGLTLAPLGLLLVTTAAGGTPAAFARAPVTSAALVMALALWAASLRIVRHRGSGG